MTLAVSVLALLLVAAFVAATRAQTQALAEIREGLTAPVQGPDEAAWHGLLRRVTDLEDAVDRLPSKWSEFEERARAAEERTRQRVRRAVESIEGGDEDGWGRLAAEADRLGVGHGGGSEQGELLPVSGSMGSVPPTAQPESWDDEAWMTVANRFKFAGS